MNVNVLVAMQTGEDAREHAACLLQLTCSPLPAAAIFSTGGMLEAAVTAESERGMKGLTLCSHDAHETQQSICLWEVNAHARGSLRKSQLHSTEAEGQQFHSPCEDTIIKEKDPEHSLLKDNNPFCLNSNYPHIIT